MYFLGVYAGVVCRLIPEMKAPSWVGGALDLYMAMPMLIRSITRSDGEHPPAWWHRGMWCLVVIVLGVLLRQVISASITGSLEDERTDEWTFILGLCCNLQMLVREVIECWRDPGELKSALRHYRSLFRSTSADRGDGGEKEPLLSARVVPDNAAERGAAAGSPTGEAHSGGALAGVR